MENQGEQASNSGRLSAHSTASSAPVAQALPVSGNTAVVAAPTGTYASTGATAHSAERATTEAHTPTGEHLTEVHAPTVASTPRQASGLLISLNGESNILTTDISPLRTRSGILRVGRRQNQARVTRDVIAIDEADEDGPQVTMYSTATTSAASDVFSSAMLTPATVPSTSFFSNAAPNSRGTFSDSIPSVVNVPSTSIFSNAAPRFSGIVARSIATLTSAPNISTTSRAAPPAIRPITIKQQAQHAYLFNTTGCPPSLQRNSTFNFAPPLSSHYFPYTQTSIADIMLSSSNIASRQSSRNKDKAIASLTSEIKELCNVVSAIYNNKKPIVESQPIAAHPNKQKPALDNMSSSTMLTTKKNSTCASSAFSCVIDVTTPDVIDTTPLSYANAVSGSIVTAKSNKKQTSANTNTLPNVNASIADTVVASNTGTTSALRSAAAKRNNNESSVSANALSNDKTSGAGVLKDKKKECQRCW
ncbi:PREDICTED: chitinase-like protein PB1E7.04c [Rhagoletis zephyria]|uniref:chitinase-like protein PB1E7.04c n=1 Tax=Rhagoletis zephyria TaxID=28612 RepID=UPI000811469B|nr:PREDICTED: chitinase-like protein PB1E7.04c [Rhagoletis zephyria]